MTETKNETKAEKVEVVKKPARGAAAKSLQDLKEVMGEASGASQSPAAEGEKKVFTRTPRAKDKLGRMYATGKRKNAVARVWLKPGSGNVTVNGKDIQQYFARPILRLIVNQPFQVLSKQSQFDVVATVSGGGLSGQAGAVKHGISVALADFDMQFRPALKSAGFLTRDSRVVERKKFGKHKARRSTQFSKR